MRIFFLSKCLVEHSNHNFGILQTTNIQGKHLQFNEYFRSCRAHSHFTQEQLVQNLYVYDVENFEGLDTNTVSKWERGITKPKLSKQVKILQYFQSITKSALPCWEKYSQHEVETRICKVGMQNLLGKSKELILNFPSKMIAADNLRVTQLRESDAIDRIIGINVEMDKGFNQGSSGLLPEDFKEWALHPFNSFFICEYKDQFFGLLFTLRLKPEIFEKVISLELKEKEIVEDNLAAMDEIGSNYIISFFAMNEKAASMLFLRYFAHLIANQKVIEEVGVATMMDDGRKLLKNMNFRYHTSQTVDTDQELRTYRETLPNFLASEQVLKMTLAKQECPEE